MEKKDSVQAIPAGQPKQRSVWDLIKWLVIVTVAYQFLMGVILKQLGLEPKINPYDSKQEVEQNEHGHSYFVGYANSLSNILEPGKECTIDVYLNFWNEQEMFQGTRRSQPKQFTSKPVMSHKFTYNWVKHEDLPSLNFTLTQSQVDKIVQRNYTLYMHM